MESTSILVESLINQANRKDAELRELRETLASTRADLEAERSAFCSREERWALRCEQIRAQARQDKAACGVRLRDAAEELRKVLDRLDVAKMELKETKHQLSCRDSKLIEYAEFLAGNKQSAKNDELSRLNVSLNAEVNLLKAQLQSERDDRARWARSRIDLLSNMIHPRQETTGPDFNHWDAYETPRSRKPFAY